MPHIPTDIWERVKRTLSYALQHIDDLESIAEGRQCCEYHASQQCEVPCQRCGHACSSHACITDNDTDDQIYSVCTEPKCGCLGFMETDK